MPVPDRRISAGLELAARGRLRHHDRLLAKITPYLAADLGEVYAGFERLRRQGTGADHQRRLWARYGPGPGFARGLAHATTPFAMAH